MPRGRPRDTRWKKTRKWAKTHPLKAALSALLVPAMAVLAYAWFNQPRLDKAPPVRVCNAFAAIRNLIPVDPSLAQTPFHLLGLDPSSYRLVAVAVHGSEEQEKFRMDVALARNRVLESIWAENNQWEARQDYVDAIHLVADMLMDRKDGPWFLLRMQPLLDDLSIGAKIKGVLGIAQTNKNRDGFIKQACAAYWN